MTMNSNQLLSGVLALVSVSTLAFAAQNSSAPSTPATATVAAAKKQLRQQDEGQRTFEQHCSRCHTAPDGFSPRISGTVLRHMRVRASLSEHEEKELLRFINP